MSDPARRAEEYLCHYLRTAWLRAGLDWDSDNDSEVGIIVDALIQAARAETVSD